MKTLTTLLGGALLAAGAFADDSALQPVLTHAGAQRALAGAVSYARAQAAPGAAIAVVDAGGHLVLLERLDGTFPAAADVSIGKARTAATFRRATRGIEDSINQGRTTMVAVAAVTAFTPLTGGVPLRVAGQVVGAIGVSGAASAQQDEEIALAGAAALSGPAVPPPQ